MSLNFYNNTPKKSRENEEGRGKRLCGKKTVSRRSLSVQV